MQIRIKAVLSAAFCNGNVNANVDDNNIIVTIKETKLYVPAVTLSARHNQELSKHLSKRFERSAYWNECKTKQKRRRKVRDIFRNNTEIRQIKFC